MYAIRSGGKVVGYSDTVVYVRLHENGCYVPCDEAEAEGFASRRQSTARTRRRARRRPISRTSFYAFADGGLLGIEPVGSVEM